MDPEEEEEEDEGPQLTKEQLSEIKVAFKMFDREGTGTVTSKEFTNVLRSIGVNTTEAELNDMIAEIDEDGNGNVEIDEFEEMMVGKMNVEDTEEDLRTTFNIFDRDESGAIDAEELYASMIKLGQRCTQQDAIDMIKVVDQNGDGVINFEEFCEMMGVNLPFPDTETVTGQSENKDKQKSVEDDKNKTATIEENKVIQEEEEQKDTEEDELKEEDENDQKENETKEEGQEGQDGEGDQKEEKAETEVIEKDD